MELKPLPRTNFVMGDTLPWTVYDKGGKIIARAGLKLDNRVLLQRVIEHGRIGETRLKLPLLEQVDIALPEAAREQLSGAEGELELALRDLNGTPSETAIQRIESIADWLTGFYHEDPDQCLGLMQLLATDHRLPRRLLHCAGLALKLSEALSYEGRRQHRLLCAALSFDVALALANDALCRQNEPLSEPQVQHIRQHPGQGVRLLEMAGVRDADWLAAIRDHHERMDGSGYPRGLKGDEMSMDSRILAIVDIYTAMVRPRADRDAQPIRRVLRDLFLERGRLVDERLAALFIRELGAFPPGTLLRLASGEIAAVARRGADPAHPLVRCVVGREGQPMARPPLRDTREAEFAIVESVPTLQFRSAMLGMDVLWALDALPSG